MEERREKSRNQPLDFNIDELISDSDSDSPATLVIVDSKTLAGEMDSSEMVDRYSDHDLLEKIERMKTITIPQLSRSLADKGEKLRKSLKVLEDERDKRNLRTPRTQTIHLEGSDEFENPVQSTRSDATGRLRDFKRETTKVQDCKDSSLASVYNRRIDGNLTNDRKSNAFEKEVSTLNRCSITKNEFESAFKRKFGDQSKTRQSHPKRCNSSSYESGKQVLCNDNAKGRATSNWFGGSRDNSSKKLFDKKIDYSQGLKLSEARPRKNQPIVLVDEDEPKLVGTSQLLKKPDESMKDVEVYYPSRDHPESVVLSYSDFDCLAPQAYLRTNIMNFYIRYLQQHASPTNSVMRNCHFFNTFFYDKLKEVLSYKGDSRDEFFIKFRRWWKGIDIFRKEYILIPINAEVHWSLVIICNPDKDELSGPIILHLDSLGLHSSKLVFHNIKSYLQLEWTHLRQQEASSSDLPFVFNIWENLPRRIVDRRIEVPQQKNDYDCGLFVLYFMERFIEDAPGRLKKKDLALLGRRWFEPEEASGLRIKIHKLLIEEFENAQKTNTSNTLPSSPPSSPSSLHDILEV